MFWIVEIKRIKMKSGIMSYLKMVGFTEEQAESHFIVLESQKNSLSQLILTTMEVLKKIKMVKKNDHSGRLVLMTGL